jgi:hypothetical protein
MKLNSLSLVDIEYEIHSRQMLHPEQLWEIKDLARCTRYAFIRIANGMSTEEAIVTTASDYSISENSLRTIIEEM